MGAHGHLPHAEHVSRRKRVHRLGSNALRRRVSDAVFGDVHPTDTRLQKRADIRKVVEVRMRDEDGVRRGELLKGQRRAVLLILSEVRVDEDARFTARKHQRRRAVPCDLHACHFQPF